MVKINVMDFHRGKEEILTMDDELPIFIFVVLQTEVRNLMAEVCLVEDYINYSTDLDNERRLLINLRVRLMNILINTYRRIKGFGKTNERALKRAGFKIFLRHLLVIL